MELSSKGNNLPLRRKNTSSRLHHLLKELSPDADDNVGSPSPDTNEMEPWMQGFQQYLDAADEIPDGTTVVEWWGVCSSILVIVLS